MIHPCWPGFECLFYLFLHEILHQVVEEIHRKGEEHYRNWLDERKRRHSLLFSQPQTVLSTFGMLLETFQRPFVLQRSSLQAHLWERDFLVRCRSLPCSPQARVRCTPGLKGFSSYSSLDQPLVLRYSRRLHG
uniref:Uncharacterized protein n=1 Tax=Lepeophtheirus salmonis TaxID=72036 RepID=A0A0K2TB54_LEPSM